MTPRSTVTPSELQSPPQDPVSGRGQETTTNGHFAEAETEEITYTPVPPRRSLAVTVRYQMRGRGKPLPYPIEDDEP